MRFEVFFDEKSSMLCREDSMKNHYILKSSSSIWGNSMENLVFWRFHRWFLKIPSQKLENASAHSWTFFIEENFKSPWVFSYDLENSCCWQTTIQNTPIHCACNAVHENSEFSKILGFIAWRFHIVLFFLIDKKHVQIMYIGSRGCLDVVGGE